MKIVSCMAGLAVSLALNATAGDFEIVKDGVSKCTIVRGNHTKSTELAVKTLQEAIEKCTGAKLNVIDDNAQAKRPDVEGNLIIVGDCPYARSKGLDSTKLKLEEFIVKADGKDLFLLGHDKANPKERATGAPQPPHPEMDSRRYSPATLWAVTEILDRYAGVRFLWPGKDGTYYPACKNLSVPKNCDLKLRPPLSRRQLWFFANLKMKQHYDDFNLYMMLQRQGSRITTHFVHAFDHWAGRYAKTKPKLFAIDPQGRRDHYWNKSLHQAKFCISNPEVLKLMLKEWRAAGSPKQWNIGPNDGRGFCVCPNCRKLDSKETQKLDAKKVWAGRCDLTLRHVWLWNKLLREMEKTTPDIQCFSFGYGAYKYFPKNAKLNSGMFIAVVPPDSSANGDGMKVWNGWSGSGAKVLLRPNWLHSFPLAPYYPLQPVAQFMLKTIADGSVGYEQDSILYGWSTQAPYYYMLARLSYRPDLSLDTIKKEFASAFGAGADDIYDYIGYWENFTVKVKAGVAEENGAPSNGLFGQALRKRPKMRANLLYSGWEALPLIYTTKVIAGAEKFLNMAEKKIENSDQAVLTKLKFLKDGLRHLKLTIKCLNLWRKKPVGRSPEFRQAYVKLQELRRKLTPRYVVIDSIINRAEKERSIQILPLNPNGTWKK